MSNEHVLMFILKEWGVFVGGDRDISREGAVVINDTSPATITNTIFPLCFPTAPSSV